MSTDDDLIQHPNIHARKAGMALVFRERLAQLIQRRGLSLSAFAKDIGLDRSALSQFMAEDANRLPRAETLAAIATRCGVSLDWLLGLIASDDQEMSGIPMLETELSDDDRDGELLTRWQQEATGYKIRYVPSGLPDLLRTEAVSRHEFSARKPGGAAAKARQTREQLQYSRQPDTDMEVCMPLQRLQVFASGGGIWKGLDEKTRLEQLSTMQRLCREMYPTFRLFLYDDRVIHASPYTVFGPKRAAIYLGDLYFVINSAEQIRVLARHFDNVIRHAVVGPDRVADYLDEITPLVSGK